jgi:hypothetical protein
MGTYVLIDLLWAGGSVAPAQPTSLRWNRGIFAQTCSTCLEGPYRNDSSGAQPCRVIDRAREPQIRSPCSLKAITNATGSRIRSSRSRSNRGTEYYHVGMKTHIEYPHIFFWKYNTPCHIEMGTYVLIDLLWAGGSVAPAQLTSLRWNWGIFAPTCSTCLEGRYRKDSSSARPCRAIDSAWAPRIPSPCILKAITHATGSKIGSSRSRWNRGTEYFPVGIKTHIEYPDIFFWKYNSLYHIEMCTYVLIDLLWEGGSVAPAQPTSLWWNWGIFAQTCSTCLEGPYRNDSFGAHPCRVIDRAWEPRIPSPCSLKAITNATGSKIGSSGYRSNRGTEY